MGGAESKSMAVQGTIASTQKRPSSSMASGGVQTGPPPNSMVRAMTFDERRSAKTSVRNDEFSDFKPLQRKAYTFVTPSKEKVMPKMSYDDILFRRHFNTTPKPLQRTISFRGVKVDEHLKESKQAEVIQPTQSSPAVVVVDPFSTGAMVSHYIASKGYHCICVWSSKLDDLADMVPSGVDIKFAKTLFFEGGDNPENENYAASLDKLANQLRSFEWEVISVLAGAETGVNLSDALSEKMQLRTNGTALTNARRNKYFMGETIRNAGVRAVKQVRVTKWMDIENFLSTWQPDPFQVILKPVNSAGSDDVFLCRSIEELKNAFGAVMGKVNGLGLVNEEVLVQEYLTGTEYVVDSVSRDGYHKIIALWEYDRRPTNGAQFVLHGQRLMTSQEAASKLLIPYIRSVLDALQIRNGPGHAEVKIHHGEAVLVEIGSRCHGGEGLWCIVEDECYGYNQALVAVNSYLNEEAYYQIPDEPTELKSSGRIKYLISHVSGKLQRLNEEYLKEIESMESFRGKDIFVHPGQAITPTIDCFSWSGAIQLVNKTEEAMLRDYQRIEAMENDNLFILQAEEVPRENCVCVVDPFSTGAIVAANVNKRNLKCVCIYSSYLDVFDGINNFIPHGVQVTFDHVIKSNLQSGTNRQENENKYADDIVEQLKKLPWNIVAIVAGCETGVELTDRLCRRLDFRRNGDMNAEARRNKYLMGEAIRSGGVRAVRQKCITSISEIESFYEMYNTTDDDRIFPVIVKPVESAGSDSVTKCWNREQLVNAVDKILQSKNQLGKQNSSVLLQEFLDGIEYVVDCISRDGVHKVVALWQYDKRQVNGADFVYFGQWLLDARDPQYAPIIEYQKSVLDALEIVNGPSHGEVKLCHGEPVEVEVGARCHGAEGAWCDLENAVYGLNQADLALDAYLGDEEAFNRIPDLCIHQGKYGVLVILVSFVEGELVEINDAYIQEIRNMSSFRGMELFVNKGEVIHKTIDCFTFAGNVKLISDDMDTIRSHYERIREMELNGLFQVRQIKEYDY